MVSLKRNKRNSRSVRIQGKQIRLVHETGSRLESRARLELPLQCADACFLKYASIFEPYCLQREIRVRFELNGLARLSKVSRSNWGYRMLASRMAKNPDRPRCAGQSKPQSQLFKFDPSVTVDLAAFQAVRLDFLDDERARHIGEIGRFLRGQLVLLRHQQQQLALGHLAQHVGKAVQGAWRQFQHWGFVPGVALCAQVKSHLDVIGFGVIQRGDKALMGNRCHLGFGFAGGVKNFLLFHGDVLFY